MTARIHEHDGRDAGADPMRYASSYHAPVLCHAVTTHLITDPAGLYVDATLGGGGHTLALLDALGPHGRVVGIDQDPDALRAAEARLADRFGERFTTVRGNFGDLQTLLDARGLTPVDGLLFDLGVSSHQIDAPERGFAFDADGPLDMRMDPGAPLDAAAVVNTWSESDLARLLRTYGEEPRAPKLARRIAAARPLATTGALADVVREAVPYRETGKTLARVFQAIRIAVNDELRALERALAGALAVLRPGGRVAVISYHSLEDRRAKRFLRYGNLAGEPVRDFYGHLQTPWRLITRKAIVADEAEIRTNPRSRSARLRVAEKL